MTASRSVATATFAEYRVLLIEDNPEDARLIEHYLKGADERYNVTVAETFREGIVYLTTGSFDVLLLDLMLPDSPAPELLTRVKADYNLPILLLTGHDDKALSRQFLQAGAQDCLYKPRLDAYWLTRAVVNAVARHKGEAQVQFQANLLEAAGEAVIATDASGCVNYWNRAAESLYGWTALEALGGAILDLTPTSTTVAQAQAIMATLAEGHEWRGEFTARHKDGSLLSIEVVDTPIRNYKGEVVGIIGVSADVSARQKAEATRLVLERALATLPVGVVISDASQPDLPISYCNNAFLNLSGYREQEVLGRNCRFLQGPETDPQEVASLRQALAAGRTYQGLLRNYRKDGSTFWNQLTVSPVHNAEVTLSHFVGIQTDVTELKEKQDALVFHARSQELLAYLSHKALTSPDLDTLLESVVHPLLAHLNITHFAIMELDAEAQCLRYRAGAGWPEGFSVEISLDELDNAPDLKERFLAPDWYVPIEVLVRDTKDFTPVGAAILEAQGIEVAMYAAIPRAEGTLFGTLYAFRKEAQDFTALEVATFKSVATLLGATISRWSVQQRVLDLNTQLERRLARLASTHRIDQAITSSLDLRFTLTVILDEVREQLGVDAAAVAAFQRETLSLSLAHQVGFRSSARQHSYFRLNDEPLGRTVLTRQTLHLSGIEAIVEAFANSPLAQEGFGSYWAVPLSAKGQVQGVLELFCRAPSAPDADWHEFLEVVATQTAIALDNATLFSSLQRANDELMMAYDETIEGWARALDLKDHETEGHSRRVTELTLALGHKLGIRGEALLHLRRGALLHDIGKMGIPDSILLKPGALSPEEFALMKKHTTYAFNLLSPISFLQPALDIPYAHHEKWDGTGYPRGLKGEEIPLAARIFALADVYDALSSDRPYRKAWPKEQVLAHLEAQSEEHFDPEVVQGFLEMMQERQNEDENSPEQSL